MMTPRDRLRVCLIFGGIAFVVCGASVASAEKNERFGEVRFRVGAWKDMGIAGAVPKEVGPWLIGCGVVALAASFFLRDR